MSTAEVDYYTDEELRDLLVRLHERYIEWRCLPDDYDPFLLSVIKAWMDDTDDGTLLEWLMSATPDLVFDWAAAQSSDEELFVAPLECDDCTGWATQRADGILLCDQCLIDRRERGQL